MDVSGPDQQMMVMISFISFAVAWKPEKYFLFLPILILSKFTSALTGLVFFFATTCRAPACLMEGSLQGTPYYSNLLVFVTDLPIGLMVWWLYTRGKAHFLES